jgi:uncharacterized membrane protein YfcA
MASNTTVRSTPFAGLLGLGFVTDFLDTLGVGSFATTSSAMKLGNLIEDDEIPGTLNVGHALPTFLEGVIYITVIDVESVTLFAMIGASLIGAWYGAGIVSALPKRAIQLGLSVGLLVTAIFIFLRQVHILEDGGTSLGLSGVALLVAVVVNGWIGAFTTLGIGNYAPCMALVAILGMDTRAAFPIMMGSAALILPVAASRFIKSGRFNKRLATALTIGGIPGVLIAAFIVKSLPLGYVNWLVVVVLLYTSVIMWRSAQVDVLEDSA